MGRLLLIRHAESEWNARGLWQGWGDPPLTRAGHAQAADLAARLEARGGIHVVVSSSLRRALQTAEPVAAALGLAVAADVRMRELGVGHWEGRTRTEIEQSDPHGLAAFDSGDPGATAGGSESMQTLAARTRPALAEHLGRVGDGDLAVVVHLGVLRTLLPGRPDPPNASYVEVEPHELELDPMAPLPVVPHGGAK